MRKKTPPQIKVGGGAADEFGSPMDIGEFLARELEQTRDMRREGLAELAQGEALVAAAQKLAERDASEVAAEARALLAQAQSKIGIADAVRQRIVAQINVLAGGAEWREQGVQARSNVRRKQGDPTRQQFDDAVRATQAAGQTVTRAHIAANWPCQTRPKDRYLSKLIHDWRSAQSK